MGFFTSPEKSLFSAMRDAIRSEDAGTPANISEMEYGELRDATLSLVRRSGKSRGEVKSSFIGRARFLIAGRGGGSPVRVLIDCLFDSDSYAEFKNRAGIGW